MNKKAVEMIPGLLGMLLLIGLGWYSVEKIFPFWFPWFYSGEKLYSEGIEAKGKNESERAVEFFERACNKKTVDACHELGEIFYYGNEELKIGREISKAIIFYTKACELNSAEGCKKVSYAYLLNGAFDKAEKFAREGIKIDPAVLGNYFNLGHSFLFRGREEDAKNVYAQWFENNGCEESSLVLLETHFKELSTIYPEYSPSVKNMLNLFTENCPVPGK